MTQRQTFASHQLAAVFSRPLTSPSGAHFSHTELAAMFAEHTFDLIVLADARGRVRYASPSVQPLLGYDPAAVLGRPAAGHVHPDDRAAATAFFARAAGREPSHATLRLRHASGAWRIVEARGVSKADRQGVLIVGRDATERAQLQADLLRLQRLDVLGRLSSGVAHDVNNQLLAIAGFVELGLHALPPGHPARAELEEIGSIAARAAQLTRQVLGFASGQPAAARPLALNDLIAGLDRFLRRLVCAPIQRTAELAPELWPVRADPRLLEQVIINLVGNARDATPDGGEIALRTANVRLDADQAAALACPPGAYVLLQVRDAGTGMDAATQARLFEPFFTTKAPERGAGLGLYACQQIIRQHGGAMHVASAPDAGTTVTCYLPRCAEQGDSASCSSLPPQHERTLQTDAT